MRPGHLETLGALCPVCLRQADRASPLGLATVVAEEDGQVVEGTLHCSHDDCLSEFPILDGMPILLPELRAYVAANIAAITARRDLSQPLESLLGDCCGPDSPYDTNRRVVASYAWDHWADQDAGEDDAEPRGPSAGPGAVVRLLAAALELAGELPTGPVLDLGCAAGRTTFELARRTASPVIGLDLNYSLLRVAAEVLRRGEARYPHRRLGLVYEHRRHRVETAGAERVDFWIGDGAALPFPPESFAAIVGLNLLDSVASPSETLTTAARALVPGGELILATPWDWSASATPVEAWLGGHSQRGAAQGAAEPALHRLLTLAGLEPIAERARHPWRVRLHDRSVVDYQTHLLVARKVARP